MEALAYSKPVITAIDAFDGLMPFDDSHQVESLANFIKKMLIIADDDLELLKLKKNSSLSYAALKQYTNSQKDQLLSLIDSKTAPLLIFANHKLNSKFGNEIQRQAIEFFGLNNKYILINEEYSEMRMKKISAKNTFKRNILLVGDHPEIDGPNIKLTYKNNQFFADLSKYKSENSAIPSFIDLHVLRYFDEHRNKNNQSGVKIFYAETLKLEYDYLCNFLGKGIDLNGHCIFSEKNTEKVVEEILFKDLRKVIVVLVSNLKAIALINQIKEFYPSSIIIINPSDVGRPVKVGERIFFPLTLRDLYRVLINNALAKKESVVPMTDQGWSLLWNIEL